MVPRLRTFHEKHGHSRVTPEDGDQELYEWVRNIRYNYLFQIRNSSSTSTSKRRRLSDEKLKTLEELDFCWETKRKWNRWDTMVGRLRDFKEDHGHTNVTKDDGDLELYEWTKNIRYTYRHQALEQDEQEETKSSRPRLSSAKFKVLQKIGFEWGTKRKQRRWDVMFPKLKAFQEGHGHTRVLKSDDTELYHWTRNLIRNYGPQLLNETDAPQKLSKQKVELLHSIGFSWETRSSIWGRRYQELRAFQKEHGHCHVPTRQYPQLGVFVQNQRQQYRRYLAGNSTTLTQERIKLLQLINFRWAQSQEMLWQERRNDLKDYWERNGHSNVPQDYANNLQLGQWCMNQRTKHRNKEVGITPDLSEERIRELEKLNFHWNYRDYQWKLMLMRLREYQEENGNLDIETTDSENSDLRQWLNEQRHYYKTEQKSRITPERIEALEGIEGFSWRKRRQGLSKDDWSQLFVAIKDKGIAPGGKTKQHWFDGVNPFEKEVKTEWTEDELLALWNEENDEDEKEDEDFEEDESSRFLRA